MCSGVAALLVFAFTWAPARKQQHGCALQLLQLWSKATVLLVRTKLSATLERGTNRTLSRWCCTIAGKRSVNVSAYGIHLLRYASHEAYHGCLSRSASNDAKPLPQHQREAQLARGYNSRGRLCCSDCTPQPAIMNMVRLFHRVIIIIIIIVEHQYRGSFAAVAF